jgi:hypothetical protein
MVNVCVNAGDPVETDVALIGEVVGSLVGVMVVEPPLLEVTTNCPALLTDQFPVESPSLPLSVNVPLEFSVAKPVPPLSWWITVLPLNIAVVNALVLFPVLLPVPPPPPHPAKANALQNPNSKQTKRRFIVITPCLM